MRLRKPGAQPTARTPGAAAEPISTLGAVTTQGVLALQRVAGNRACVGVLTGSAPPSSGRHASQEPLPVQRALHPIPEPTGKGVHHYLPEAEDRAPRGVYGAAQADAGHYQYLGDNVFQKVVWDSNAAVWKAGDAGFFFHHAPSGTLRRHHSRGPRRGEPSDWRAPAPTKSNAGSPLGRSDADVYPLGWTPVPGATDDDVRRAQELADKLRLRRVDDPAGWQVVPTIVGSPLVLLIQVGDRPEEGEDWAGRDQQVEAMASQLDDVWAELARRTGGGVKSSGDWTPAPHVTPRKMRPTSKYFGRRSATDAYTGRENKERPGKTQYEWSHLIGDADGGGNRPDNLVSATTAANTEQLILETVQREYRELLASHDLQLQIAGAATLIFYEPTLHQNYKHVANWLRYTVTIRSAQKRVRVLDHIFDAQRQKISKGTTTVMLAQAEMAIDDALEREFGIVRPNSRRAQPRTVPTIPYPPAQAPPTGRTRGDLLAYLAPVSNLEAQDAPLLMRLRSAIQLGFSRDDVLICLRRYGFPTDELPTDWAAQG